ncbi:ArsR/SmtB family transcription factor [Achromobacter deleyi]|uniref:ArsR/SmtB family transcription factor n=1 Tax=Achromobacter deleyi TaxID=1353891 RepID=UPI001492E706|nr:metalloregulator ArsR/SmtB family transcription factor [Achromobacter deleyi]QVQ27426.1 helix-turn-helix transcriptional regulator [Achromobacter deleyi]UIP23022.1 metalloregulator ArsR/SmtB family transcription factor [Achromobacter deleyi]
MVNFNDNMLDGIFSALADGTRRRVLADLEQGSASVSALARPHAMSLPAFMKHLRVLEDAGLIARAKDGRVVSCTLSPEPMRAASDWLSRYEKFWNGQLDSLARYLYHEEETHPWKTEAPLPTPTSNSGSGGASTPPSSGSGAPGRTRKR